MYIMRYILYRSKLMHHELIHFVVAAKEQQPQHHPQLIGQPRLGHHLRKGEGVTFDSITPRMRSQLRSMLFIDPRACTQV